MFEAMDPMVKYWMYNNWVEDYQDNYKMLENIAYLLGSFINPELVQRVLGKSTENYETSDEEFDATSKAILEEQREKEAEEGTAKRRKKRKRIKS